MSRRRAEKGSLPRAPGVGGRPPQAPASGRAASGAGYRWFVGAVLLAALGVRLVLLCQLEGHLLLQPTGALDDAAYAALARRVAAGDLALAPDAYFLSPFYTYFLGLLFAVTGGSVLAARIVQVLLGTAAVWLIIATGRAWFGERVAIVAGGLAVLTGLFAFNELLILQSSVDPFLTALALYLLTRAVHHPSGSRFAAAGLALGVLTLNRPNVLPAVFTAGLVWLLTNRSRAALRGSAAFVLGALLAVAPVTARNRVVAGEWVLLTSHGGLNFYIGNGEGAEGTWRAIPGISRSIQGQEQDVRRVAGEALGRGVSSKEADSYFYGLAWSWVRQHPGEWLRLLWRKMVLTLTAADAALNYSYAYFAKDERTLLPLLFVGPWLIVPLGVFGLGLGPAGERAAWWTWLSFTPAYAATLIAFFVSSRYRLPLLVPLLLGAARSVDWAVASVRGSGRDAVVWQGAGLCLLVLFVNWPVRTNDGRMDEREQYIVMLLAQGRTDEAVTLLADTERQHPRPGLLLNRVALVLRQNGDSSLALTYLQRAVQADPRDARIRLNLGETLLEAGRAVEALPHLDIALRSGLSPFSASYDMAEALLAAGRPAEARTHLRELPVSSDVSAAGLVSLGSLALRLEDPATAERFLRAAVSREASGEAHHLLGVALGAQGKPGEALPELEQAARLQPRDASVHVHLALVLAQTGRRGDARRLLEGVLQAEPGNEGARQLLEEIAR